MNEFIINDYEDFKRAIRESNEQRAYVGGGDRRYINAIHKLIAEDHDRYNQYSQKLILEHNSKYEEVRS